MDKSQQIDDVRDALVEISGWLAEASEGAVGEEARLLIVVADKMLPLSEAVRAYAAHVKGICADSRDSIRYGVEVLPGVYRSVEAPLDGKVEDPLSFMPAPVDPSTEKKERAK